MTTKTEPKATERELLDLLERRHAKTGNGGSGEFAFMRQLRNDAGFKATRSFDGAAVSLWPSRGFELHIFEVKVTKADWRHELSGRVDQRGREHGGPTKAEDACSIADRFTVVAPRGIIDPAEVPVTWGHIEAYGGQVDEETGEVVGRKLRVVKPAPLLHDRGKRTTFPAGLVVSMLRAAGAVPDHQTPAEAALRAAAEQARADADASWQATMIQVRDERNTLRELVRAFERESGVPIQPNIRVTQEDVLAGARRIRAALADEHHEQKVRDRLTTLHADLASATATIGHLLEHPDQRPTAGRVMGA
jgi:hypothetical protein